MNLNIFVVDPGASRTKAIGFKGSGKPSFLSMSPYCAEAPMGEGARLKGLWPDGVALESSWVGDIDGTYLLGTGAAKYRASSLSNAELKYKKALYKVLGVIGHFAKEWSLPNRSQIAVGVLLPFDEYATSSNLQRWFKAAIQQFDFCGSTFGFELAEMLVRPEGAGVYMRGLPKTVTPKSCRVASLVVGHRNASWLVSDRGAPDIAASETCDLGCRWLIDAIKQTTGHKNELWITSQLFYDGGDTDVRAAYRELLPTYWAQLQGWIQEQASVDHVVMSGGTCLLLKSHLETVPNAIWPSGLLG